MGSVQGREAVALLERLIPSFVSHRFELLAALFIDETQYKEHRYHGTKGAEGSYTKNDKNITGLTKHMACRLGHAGPRPFQRLVRQAHPISIEGVQQVMARGQVERIATA
ncbi:hypothetical protein HVA01_03180 [Halovibrio variabilis]|uniref:Uncharacterized protein n=1 Tax=Halovibrio variabilis TaxID=31910 RepID=A0A511UNE1_9GAMM|nr:hypothetical protein HVA01_03180 [Halovibrio variabilis]